MFSVKYVKKTAKRDLAVKCVTCGYASHVTCLVNSFVSINRGANKSGTQLLSDFLNCRNFQYTCQQCIDLTKSIRLTWQKSAVSESVMSEIRTQITNVGVRIDD